MKRLVLWMSLLAIAIGLSTCNDEDMPRFQFNANGECYMPDARNISHEEFLKHAGGNGWQHVSTYEINRDGSVENKSYYEDLTGGGPRSYYFGRDSYTSYFWYNAYPALAYITYPYSYKDKNRIGVTNHLDDGFITQFQVLSINENELQLIESLGIRAGENVYGLVTYRKMTGEELKEYQEKYTDYYDLVYDASYMFRPFGELTVEKFEKEIVGYGWRWNYTHEISEDTTYTMRNYYSDGDKTSHYYFEKDTLTRFYQKSGSFVYSKEPYTLMLDAFPYRLVNDATGDTLYLYFAQNPELDYREVLRMDNGKPVYGFTSLWRMSDAKLQEFRQKYATEVKHDYGPYLAYSVKEGILHMEIIDYTINCGVKDVAYEFKHQDDGVVQVLITETGDASANCFDYTTLSFPVPDLSMGETYQFEIKAKSLGGGVHMPVIEIVSIRLEEGAEGKFNAKGKPIKEA